MAGLLKARLPDLKLEAVRDPRKPKGKRWTLSTMLRMGIVGLMSRCKSLAQTESLSDEMSIGMARLLGVSRRIPDTTMRDALVRVSPHQLRHCLYKQVKAARRRKALAPNNLPFGVVAIDGKTTAIEVWDHKYAQRKRDPYGGGIKGLVRTLTCTLVSSRAKVCIDAVPIHASTNEMGQFQKALHNLDKTYGKKLFRLISTDAGMCSLENADSVVEAKKEYLFCIKNDQPNLLAEAKRLLGSEEKHLAQTVDIVGQYEVTRRLYITEEMSGYLKWSHLRTSIRVESIKVNIRSGRVDEYENRYFISSLKVNELSFGQWLYVIRQHWCIENHCHQTWDKVFREDDHPWIECNPQGTLVVMLLRRMAYNLMALFRSVSQRSEHRRQTPWKDVMRWLYNALICVDESQIASLRQRPEVAITS
jgi:predicted transposase YbfD/YdcC